MNTVIGNYIIAGLSVIQLFMVVVLLVLMLVFLIAFLNFLKQEKIKSAIADAESQRENERMTHARQQQELADWNNNISEKVRIIRELLLHPCVIDSNIWMKSNYDFFFDILEIISKEYSLPVFLLGTQYDEMNNIKRRNDFDSERGRNARLALARVERIQKKGLIVFDSLNIGDDPNAYADPDIIRYMVDKAKSSNKVFLVCDDVDLRIRAREKLNEIKTCESHIIGMNDIKDSLMEPHVRLGELRPDSNHHYCKIARVLESEFIKVFQMRQKRR